MLRIFTPLSCMALLGLSSCATHTSSKLSLQKAEIQGQVADTLFGMTWKNAGISDLKREMWTRSWAVQQQNWHDVFDQAKLACDSAKSLSWNFTKRQRQLNRCQEYSTVLQSRAQAMQNWGVLSRALAEHADTLGLVQGPFDLGWKVPSNCAELSKWMNKVPHFLRFDSLSLSGRMAANPELLSLNADQMNWQDRWNWVKSNCASDSRPDPKWYWVESLAWKWWSLSAQAATLQMQMQFQQKSLDSLEHLSQSELENSLKNSTELARCEAALQKSTLAQQSMQDSLSRSESRSQKQLWETQKLLQNCQNPMESLRYLSQSAFHIAPMDSEQKIIRLEIADSSFQAGEPNQTLGQNLARLAGIWSKSDRPLLVLGCDGYSDLGRKAEKVRSQLLLQGLDEIQCLSTQSSSQVPRFEIVIVQRQ